jgi:hypothetical protein
MEKSKLNKAEKVRRVKRKVKGMLIIFCYEGDCSERICPGRPKIHFYILL